MSLPFFEQSAPIVLPGALFAGSDYVPKRDEERLTKQIDCIRTFVSDGVWRGVGQLAKELRRAYPKVIFPENSVQAQLRNLRKLGYRVEKRNVAKRGLCFEYRVLPPLAPAAEQLSMGVSQ